MSTTMNGCEKTMIAVGATAAVIAVASATVGTVALVRANRANRGVADLYGQVGMIQQTMQMACTPMGGSFVPQMNGGSNGIV